MKFVAFLEVIGTIVVAVIVYKGLLAYFSQYIPKTGEKDDSNTKE